MQLTLFSDYSLRLLLHLGANEGRLVTVSETAESYAISRHHLVKVSQLLIRLGYVESVRGRRGGLRLARPVGEINVGQLIRETEPDLNLVECFDREHGTCVLKSQCDLKGLLHRAQAEFFRVLDAHTLADLMKHRRSYELAWAATKKSASRGRTGPRGGTA